MGERGLGNRKAKGCASALDRIGQGGQNGKALRRSGSASAKKSRTAFDFSTRKLGQVARHGFLSEGAMGCAKGLC
jgi:hypothetical protein